jgi:hypothetical protein
MQMYQRTGDSRLFSLILRVSTKIKTLLQKQHLSCLNPLLIIPLCVATRQKQPRLWIVYNCNFTLYPFLKDLACVS